MSFCCNASSEEMFKLSDFGVARPLGVAATFRTAVVGTPGYMAPEQVADGKVNVASDVFSLACLTYFILTGDEYIPATNPLETLAMTVRGPRPKLLDAQGLCPELRGDPDVCALLDDHLARASSREPTQRPRSARAFAAALLPHLQRFVVPTSDHHPIEAQVRQAALAKMNWIVRHPHGDAIIVWSAGWDGDGQCLAVTDVGMR
jgi:serine/threonine protein kinase